MRSIQPPASLAEARAVLDAGGRLPGSGTAGDGIISGAELFRAAGVYKNEQAAFLYLELALSALNAAEREEALAWLEEPLRTRYEENRPAIVTPSTMPQGLECVGRSFVLFGRLRYWRQIEMPPSTKKELGALVLKLLGVALQPSLATSLGANDPVKVKFYKVFDLDAPDDETHHSLLMIPDSKASVHRIRVWGGVAKPLGTHAPSSTLRRYRRRRGPPHPRVYLEPLYFVVEQDS